MGLQIFQQLTGINIVVAFGSLFFRSAGLTGDKAILGTLLTSCGALAGIVLLLTSIDRFGRRSVLLSSSTVLFASITTAGIIGVTAPAGPMSPTLGWIMIGDMILFQFGFALGWGAIPWVYPSEIFTLRTKARGMAVSVSAQFTTNFIVVYGFPNVNKVIGIYNVCFVLAGFIALSGVFVLIFLPETMGIALEDMDALFGSSTVPPKAERTMGLGPPPVGSESIEEQSKPQLKL